MLNNILDFQFQVSRLCVWCNDQPYDKLEFKKRFHSLLKEALSGTPFHVCPNVKFDDDNDKVMTVYVTDNDGQKHSLRLGECNVLSYWKNITIDDCVKTDIYSIAFELLNLSTKIIQKTTNVSVPTDNGNVIVSVTTSNKATEEEIKKLAIEKAFSDNLKIVKDKRAKIDLFNFDTVVKVDNEYVVGVCIVGA